MQTNSTSKIIDRIATLTSHLSSSTSQTNKPGQTMASRPPITCHVLDTTLGRPGGNIPVSLTLLSTTGFCPRFNGITNADGRVTAWSTELSGFPPSLETVFHDAESSATRWSLKFDVSRYFGEREIEAFFEEVEIKFVVRSRKEHYHVPVLLGPYNYTTYRGS
ncbi:Hydroxyisourate hydrolase [Patellaria atrata CBS 101060]|uniref:hydroxyisourate hydrolase n=1 Tax=Patellaria atrata CBS 101060 TaxID=1346257 RepID=A0A9P4SH88_9PEZI|nr:Hydroxyisourate hydrolase [Patellaria atrata CBS 101060]